MYIANTLIESVNNKTPVIFIKYGDGEHLCANFHQGYNCDRDNFTIQKGNQLIESFRYFVHDTSNTYIGRWPHDHSQTLFWENLAHPNTIKWVDFHSIIIEHQDLWNNSVLHDKIKLYETIQKSPVKKIVVCNEMLQKSEILLNADVMVTVPIKNWHDTCFAQTVESVLTAIGDEEFFIVMTAAGMAAKPLIAELHKLKPNGIYIDFGSAMDFICTKTETRIHRYPYETIFNLFRHILPDTWDDPKYDTVIQRASTKLGIYAVDHS